MGIVTIGKPGFTKRRRRTERRKTPRHISLRRYSVAVFPLSDTDSGHSTELLAVGIMTDLSRESIGLILNQPIEEGMGVMVVINPGSPLERGLAAKTIWAGPLPSSGHVLKPGGQTPNDGSWRVGLRFTPTENSQAEYVELLISQSLG